MEQYDFSGWATRNDLLCSDGRTIRKDAFKAQDGETVPLVWNHNHASNDNVLGHALLENRDEGVYAYCTFNDTESGLNAKKLVQHGDVRSLSILANQLKQQGSDVLHGTIRELSLVLAGANPGAFIDKVMAHGEDDPDQLIIGYDENIMLLCHADDSSEKQDKEDKTEKKPEEKKEDDKTIAEVFKEFTEKEKNVLYFLVNTALNGDLEKKGAGNESTTVAHADDSEDGETLKDIYDGMSKEKKNLVNLLIRLAMEEKEESDSDEGGDDEMKHNIFDKSDARGNDVLCHADQETILELAKKSSVGTFQNALQLYAEENNLTLQHDAISGGFVQSGEGNVTMLFPEYQEVRPGAPELITNDQGWVGAVMRKVHKSPISRVRTSQVDIRNIDSLRAKGYQKGKQKAQAGTFKLLRRTTDPQTIYVKNALHRDDIVDITDFDYVQYLYNIDRMMLNETLATAIMIGDSREDADSDKIFPEHIRPIWQDDDLYTLHVDLDLEAAKAELQGTNTGANFGENYITAEAMINALLYAREKYKGTGTPDMYITPHMLNVMLLARDLNGRRIYASKAELAAALDVGEIHTAEQFENKTRKTDDSKTKKLLALVTNLADYNLGATKGGQVTHFTQFDIDFNQEKSLLETRCSGALTRVYSAIAIEEDVTGSF